MVDDKKVQQIVTDTLNRHLGDSKAAWEDLYRQRNDPGKPNASTDVDLAAAEHYMLNRYWVGHGLYAASQMKMLTHAYHLAKKSLPESWLRHDENRPTTPPSAEALSWGLKGILDGENERQKNKIPAPSFFQMPPSFNPATDGYRKGYGVYGYGD